MNRDSPVCASMLDRYVMTRATPNTHAQRLAPKARLAPLKIKMYVGYICDKRATLQP